MSSSFHRISLFSCRILFLGKEKKTYFFVFFVITRSMINSTNRKIYENGISNEVKRREEKEWIIMFWWLFVNSICVSTILKLFSVWQFNWIKIPIQGNDDRRTELLFFYSLVLDTEKNELFTRCKGRKRSNGCRFNIFFFIYFDLLSRTNSWKHFFFSKWVKKNGQNIQFLQWQTHLISSHPITLNC